MKNAAGFTLIEIAVVVAIVGFLLGGLLIPLSNQIDVTRMQETEDELDEIRDALLGYAIVNGNRFPCPDTDDDGDAETAPCDNSEGTLPYITLGVDGFDTWGRPYRYLADNNYTDPLGVPNPPDTDCCLNIVDRAGDELTDPSTPGPPSTNHDNGPAAVVFSCGKNGVPDLGNDNDGTPNTAATCTNPGASDGIYVQDVYTEGTFDDMLVWISKNTLINKLVGASVWP